MMLQVADHVTVAGKVIKVENGCALIKAKESEFWITDKDVKTYRPMGEKDNG